MHFILTGKHAYNGWAPADDVRKGGDRYVKGGRVYVDDRKILHSTHPYHKAMLRAMDLCLVDDPRDRASAKQIADLLAKTRRELGW